MSYTLYYWPTPNAHKVSMFLEEADLSYNVKPINITKGEQFFKEFLAIAPNNKIPAITHHRSSGGDLHLFESGAILVYLAETHKKFLPSQGEGRYQTLQWLFWQMGGLGPMAGQNHHFNMYAATKIPYAIDRYVSETTRLYSVIDKQLSRHEFVAGSTLSIADFAIYPWIVPWKQQSQDLENSPHLNRWVNHMQQRPATQKAYAISEQFKNPVELDEQARKILFPSAKT